jgi:predicted nucleic acid-binding protein
VITAVDSSVLLAIYKNEADGEAWLDLLASQCRLGRLIVSEIVVAEIGALFPGNREAMTFLQDLGVEFEPVDVKSALLAGEIFKAYRRAGGPREHLIPDFLIGAHAQVQASQLAASDRGFLRRYFPKLKVIAPR